MFCNCNEINMFFAPFFSVHLCILLMWLIIQFSALQNALFSFAFYIKTVKNKLFATFECKRIPFMVSHFLLNFFPY